LEKRTAPFALSKGERQGERKENMGEGGKKEKLGNLRNRQNFLHPLKLSVSRNFKS
jgi:hypothetical protein